VVASKVNSALWARAGAAAGGAPARAWRSPQRSWSYRTSPARPARPALARRVRASASSSSRRPSEAAAQEAGQACSAAAMQTPATQTPAPLSALGCPPAAARPRRALARLRAAARCANTSALAFRAGTALARRRCRRNIAASRGEAEQTFRRGDGVRVRVRARLGRGGDDERAALCLQRLVLRQVAAQAAPDGADAPGRARARALLRRLRARRQARLSGRGRREVAQARVGALVAVLRASKCTGSHRASAGPAQCAFVAGV